MKEQLKPRGLGAARDIREAFLESRPDVRELWDAHRERRSLALAFVHMRQLAHLSQSQVAERAHWGKSYVSRLESIDNGSIPDTGTIARYAQACGMDAVLVFTHSGERRVADFVRLQPADAAAAEESAAVWR
jgi:transcriptional regulator with XRE-family HTH domain